MVVSVAEQVGISLTQSQKRQVSGTIGGNNSSIKRNCRQFDLPPLVYHRFIKRRMTLLSNYSVKTQKLKKNILI